MRPMRRKDFAAFAVGLGLTVVFALGAPRAVRVARGVNREIESLRFELQHSWTGTNIKLSERTGDQIVAWLESYRRRYGRYPAELEGLVPEYCGEESPPPLSGIVGITRSSADKFFLMFGLKINCDSVYPSGSYEAGGQRWFINN